MRMIRYIKFFTTILLWLLLPVSDIQANDDIIQFAKSVNEDVDRRFTKKAKSFYTSFFSLKSQDDLLTGLKLGFEASQKNDIYFNIYYAIRPYKKSVEDNNIMVDEERNLMGIGLDKFVFITYDFGMFFNAGIGYTSDKYLGITWEKTKGFAYSVGAGLYYYLFDFINIRVGYQYMPMPNAPDHWGQASIDFSF